MRCMKKSIFIVLSIIATAAAILQLHGVAEKLDRSFDKKIQRAPKIAMPSGNGSRIGGGGRRV